MAISPTTGGTAALTTAGTSLSFAANTLTNGQTVVVCVATPPGTIVNINSITDTGGNTYAPIFPVWHGGVVPLPQAIIYAATVTSATGSRTITINFNASTLAVAAYEVYAGPISLTGTTTSSGITPSNYLNDYPSIGSGNTGWGVSLLSWSTTSADTASANNGTIRQSIVSTGATLGLVMMDNVCLTGGTLNACFLSASRNWTPYNIGLIDNIGGGYVVAPPAYEGPVPNPANPASHQAVKAPPPITGSTPVPVAQVLQNGTVGIAYSETISAQGGVSPYTFSVTTGALPSGTSLNGTTGVISGTPTTAGTYNFTVKVTDANGSTGTQAFQIIVANPSVGAGGSFTYAG